MRLEITQNHYCVGLVNKLNCYSMFTCLADGVMPICTTMMARVMFSSCILWQYILMVLIPTFGSSEKDQKKTADVISYVCIAICSHFIISIHSQFKSQYWPHL